MTTTRDHDERIANMTFASVYPHYVAKVEKKGRTEDELLEVISWLTGFKAKDLKRLIQSKATFEQFFAEATLNPNASLITGTICGYRIEEIQTPLTRQVRYLDKLVDELAKGRRVAPIARQSVCEAQEALGWRRHGVPVEFAGDAPKIASCRCAALFASKLGYPTSS